MAALWITKSERRDGLCVFTLRKARIALQQAA